MKSKNLIPLLLATLLTASCAELNTALESANQALGTLNGATSSTSSTANNHSGDKTTIALANKSTAQFETRNMQLEVYQDGCRPNGDMVSLTGEVRNKTNKSFTFIVKNPPVAVQLLELTKAKSGSAQPNRKKIAEITWEQVKTIAAEKMSDLNCFTVESAMRMVAGTARSMGITVKGEFPENV